MPLDIQKFVRDVQPKRTVLLFGRRIFNSIRCPERPAIAETF